MLRLGKLADYALLIATHLATDDLQATTDELADALQIPKATVRKLMKQLVDAGIVASLRGMKGGYRLSRPAIEINIYQVLEAVSGPLCLTDCCDRKFRCDKGKRCTLITNWQYLNEQVKQQFSTISVKDMTANLSRS